MFLVSAALIVLVGCATSTPDPSGVMGSPPAEVTEAILAVAASVITPETSLQHLSVLAHDSLMGRGSERPEIWTAARYIAGEFAAMGLEPMDENGDFIDDYPIRIPELDPAQTRMILEAGGENLELTCGKDFAISPSLKSPEITGVALAPVVGYDWYRANPGSLPEGSLVLTYGPMMGMGEITEALRFGGWMENVLEAGAEAVGMILPAQLPSEMMPVLAEQIAANPTLEGPPMLLFPVSTVQRIFEFAGAGVPENDPIETIQYARLTVSLEMQVTTRTIMAPNVLARLPGARSEDLDGVVLTAHFDHEPPGQPNEDGDSIYNGADDNASGTVGLMETARAFAALPGPPLRSVVFAAVSAEEMGLLGSTHLAKQGPAPASSTAASLNMDMLSRNGPDSIFVFGQTYSSLGAVFREVLEGHPELGFQVRPSLQMPELDLIRFSDQFPFMARGVPVLMFNSGFHPDLHTPDDEVDRADSDKLARAARLMFYLAWAVANDPTDPVWTEEGRTRTEAMQKRLKR
jgi:hypothetical protein